jgi:hypothetical protein
MVGTGCAMTRKPGNSATKRTIVSRWKRMGMDGKLRNAFMRGKDTLFSLNEICNNAVQGSY